MYNENNFIENELNREVNRISEILQELGYLTSFYENEEHLYPEDVHPLQKGELRRNKYLLEHVTNLLKAERNRLKKIRGIRPPGRYE